MRSTSHGRFVTTVALLLAGLAAIWPDFARGEVERVVIKETRNLDPVGARRYLWANAMMEGRVDRGGGEVGRYRVPVVLIYPDRDPNGVGFVDLVNSASFWLYEEGATPWGPRNLFYVGDTLLGDYLKQQGFLYMSVEWSRMVTEELGPNYGVIENGLDGYQIIRDAARFLRDVSKLKGTLPFGPSNATHVIAFGQSQTGMLLRQILGTSEHRTSAGVQAYDGYLVGVAGGECYVLNNDATPRPGPGPTIPVFGEGGFGEGGACKHMLPSDAKVIAIDTESDLQAFGGHLARQDTQNYRKYELAGIAHIPGESFDLRPYGATQIQEGFRAVYKAALQNLIEWISKGPAPPPSRYIEGSLKAEGRFVIDRDADGNAKGGLRLPHMAAVLRNRQAAGAPLGRYDGLDPEHADPINVFLWLGGIFEPFPDSELAKRYPNNEAYVERVTRAADALLADRFILPEDRDAYVKSARQWRRDLAKAGQ